VENITGKKRLKFHTIGTSVPSSEEAGEQKKVISSKNTIAVVPSKDTE